MHSRFRLLAGLALVVGLVTATLGAQVGAGANSLDRYIVQLSDPALASYRGGIGGLAATNPAARGEVKLNPDSPASAAYLAHLANRQASFISAAQSALGRPVDVVSRYRYAFDGVALSATGDEAARLRSLPGVKAVRKEEILSLDTDAGPTWIGAPSVWNGTGTGGLAGTKGEGIVAGIIDTGINTDHPSFADVGGDGYNHANPRGRFYGLCDPVLGKPFCNDKLIGVWDFTGTSPEDDNEHGSHTASTVAGNVLDATIHAPTIDLTRHISGVAPHANLITYKACDSVSGGCRGISLQAAIDQATADAVDVINFSIGGGSDDPWDDSNALGFLGARDAGIFVSASAGNSGPRPETMGSPANAPWLLAVGAATHNRKFVNALVSMSGGATAPPANISGKSVTSAYGPAKIVYAGAAPYNNALCGAGPASPTGEAAVNPFPPGTFHGEIVVCDRGTYGRVEKASNVKEGGAGGFVLANDEANGGSLIGDAYPIPGVHISYADGLRLKSWLASGSGQTGSIAGTTADTAAANGDVLASFSSRGPDKTLPDVLKPDISAPGVDILAAIHTLGNTTSPPGTAEFGVLSGTSMASPHMAGAGALLRALHRTWTPDDVRAALMTTAQNTGVRKEDGVKAADAFDTGAGRVDLSKAGQAGLTLRETTANFESANPSAGGDPTTLNIPSLGDARCDTSCSWTRIVTSTLGSSATWTVKTSGPRGLGLTVTPSKFTLAAGASQALTIKADVSKMPVGKWIFAQVVLAATGAPAAHLPVAVKTGAPVPVSITTTSASGSQAVTMMSGVAISRFTSVVSGLTKGQVIARQVEPDPTFLDPYDASVGTFYTTVDVTSADQARFLTGEVTKSTAPDVDLYVGIDQDGDKAPDEAELVCTSASEIAVGESCSFQSPSAGTYWFLVQNWAAGTLVLGDQSTGQLPKDDVELVVSLIPGVNKGNLTVTAPTSVAAGTPFDISLGWSGLDAGTWFGLVEYGSDSRHPDNAGSLFVKISRSG